MDHIRQDLDELMGKDRNHPLHVRLRKRDHFDDEQVCKYNLLSFCPHDLFPNTKADLGPCKKRHDEYLKDMFLSDPDKARYQRKYEKELQALLEQMIAQVDQKIKRSLQRIEIPGGSSGPGAGGGQNEGGINLNAPEMNSFQQEVTNQKIDALEQKINFFIDKAEKLGEDGKIDESEAIMKEVEKLKIQKLDLEALQDPSLAQSSRQDKNAMKVCEICGGLQTASDTDKRMVMHVEGKLHTGYARIRKTLSDLKAKRDEYRRESDRRGGHRSRSRSASLNGRTSQRKSNNQNHNNGNAQNEKVDEHFYYSSKRLGSGVNCHDTTEIRFSEYALQLNSASGENVVLQSIEKLGKEWGYYKRNIDKQRRELQNEQKRKEEEAKRLARYEDRGAYRGADSGFRRPASPPRGGGRDYGGRSGGYESRRDDARPPRDHGSRENYGGSSRYGGGGRESSRY